MKALFLGNVAADTCDGIRAELPPRAGGTSFRRPEGAAERAEIAADGGYSGQQSLARRVSAGAAGPPGAVGGDRGRIVRPRRLAERRGGVQRVRPRDRDRRIHDHGPGWRCSHRLFQIAGEFREHGSWRTSWVESGAPHGEVRGSTLGIVGYGRVGREVARRAAPFGGRILAANRIAARAPIPGSSGSIRWPNSTGCCRNATRWRSAPRSAPRRRG